MTKTTILLAITLSSPMWATEGPKPNPEVDIAVTAAFADAEKAFDSYKAVMIKATDKAVKDLDKAKLHMMKKGDLASANELDAIVKELKKGGLEKLVIERKNVGGDLLSNAQKAPIVGTWNIVYNNGVKRRIVIGEDCNVKVIDGISVGSSFTLSYDNNRKLYVGCFGPNKKPETYKLVDGKLEIDHWGIVGSDWKSSPPTATGIGIKEQ